MIDNRHNCITEYCSALEWLFICYQGLFVFSYFITISRCKHLNNLTVDYLFKSNPCLVSSTEVQPVFLEAIVSTLDCSENDYVALFALCLLYAISHNKGSNFFKCLQYSITKVGYNS